MNPLRQAARLTRPVIRARIPQRAISTTSRLSAESAPAVKGDHASDHAQHDSHGHDSHYDAPGGWLWGIRPGEKYESEGWEIPFYLMCGGLAVAVVAYTMKEDTSYVCPEGN